MPLNLTPAIPELSGITPEHLLAIAEQCRVDNVFLIVRPSEKETMTLIKAGFACKNMDIHDKSSNWGMMAGMVPVDPRFSKKKIGQAVTDINKLKKTHGHAKSVHLTFDSEWMGLIGPHFKVRAKSLGGSGRNAVVALRSGVSSGCVCGGRTTEGTKWVTHWQHYSDELNGVCFLMDPSKRIYWRWLDANKNHGIPDTGVPLYVWAYNGIPVTGDYDVWMLAPHVSNSELDKTREIDSRKDDAGRSAATQFYTEFLGKLNGLCRRVKGGNVFHHGAESQNVSFTQELNEADRRNTVFCPGTHVPFMVNNNDLPLLIYEMLQHGYVATLNPKWRTGITLGGEDMAYLRDDSIGWEKAIVERNVGTVGQSGSSDAVANLETEAALRIQRLFRSRKTATPTSRSIALDHEEVMKNAELQAVELRKSVFANTMTEAQAIDTLNGAWFKGVNRGMALTVYNKTKFADRLKKMALMRKVARATGVRPAASDSKVDDHFPLNCFNAKIDKSRFEARRLALEQENSLKRRGFADDGHGGVTPVDRTERGTQ